MAKVIKLSAEIARRKVGELRKLDKRQKAFALLLVIVILMIVAGVCYEFIDRSDVNNNAQPTVAVKTSMKYIDGVVLAVNNDELMVMAQEEGKTDKTTVKAKMTQATRLQRMVVNNNSTDGTNLGQLSDIVMNTNISSMLVGQNNNILYLSYYVFE